ncbi:hypothetical protein BJ742DRAFT_805310 [Cladochytrium replicatum]|nr:hypothetical protein BJ742DRAFT_805310 [Cladochytrium replicatum]
MEPGTRRKTIQILPTLFEGIGKKSRDSWDPDTSSLQDHPKIIVESASDIRYLKQQMRIGAQRWVDRRLAAKKLEWMEGRAKAEEFAKMEEEYVKFLRDCVDAAIEEQFDIAGPNILVNGLPYHDAVKTVARYQPYDPEISQRIQALKDEIDLEVMMLSAPQSEMRKMLAEDLLDDEVDFMEDAMEVDEDDKIVLVHSAANLFEQSQALLASINMDRLTEEFSEGVEMLKEQMADCPALLERFERAQVLLDDLGVGRVPASNPMPVS